MVRSRCLLLAALLGCGAAPEKAPLAWGGDAEGGAPFVEADPQHPSDVRGFDVGVAKLIAEHMRRTPRFVQVPWSSIEQSVERGDFALGMSGVEDRSELRARHSVSIPYYEFTEVLAVRTADSTRYQRLDDLRGRRVGTLGATGAYTILVDAHTSLGIVPVSYDDDVHPYADLVAGRVDAVLLDNIIAERSLTRIGGFRIQPVPVATGHYVAVMARSATALRDSVNDALRAGMRDGRIEQILRSWGVWNAAQARLFARVLAAPDSTDAARSASAPATHYLPSLLRAAGITLLVSCLAMLLAVTCGLAIAAGRVYGGRVVGLLLTAYVEVIRGTPVLLQLFVIYYGLSGVIRLPALAAAILGLGLNYAAYESEIYRSALLNVGRAQLEAGRTLGLSEWQILRLVRAPQALRVALAPMTNDFVALLKDSSLVSVITLVELTKQTAIYATNVGSWVVPGVLCALIYLAMSLPLSHLARQLERRWSSA